MKAARWHGVKDIRVEDISEPSPAAGEVKVKVAWTGICGSDLHEYLAGPIFVPVDDHPGQPGVHPCRRDNKFRLAHGLY